MKITEYSEEQIKQLVRDGIAPVQALRDYKILKQIENGDKITNVAYDNNVSRVSIYNMKKKYSPKGL